MHILDSGIKKYAETKRLIRNAMSERQLVLFVGAGASVDAGMPLWGEVVSQIAEKLNLDDKKHLENLIIPQYYYNARGRKEYIQLMREIFRYNDKLYPGKIQDAIIRFDVETIITTNYDHLIEQAAENNGEFLYVVSQDSDLPYRKAGKELIKMHGDFEHDNFVLKEDDYLHYQKNFKLIENYVKSLIGTKVVLFIGYSLGDPDVKHIFSWVKEILDDHFQRAYLIVTGKDANQNEIEYFKCLGVNIIYARELFDENDIKPDDQSEQLLQTLNYFLDGEEKNKGIVDSLYDNLKPFASLRYTYRKYIDWAFNQLRNKINEGITLLLDNDNYISFIERHALDEEKEFWEELNHAIKGESKNQEVLTIAEVLRKSAVRGTNRMITENAKIHYDRKEFSYKNSDSEWVEAISNFDYRKLCQIKEFNSKILSESKPELYLQQAYICSFLGDYLSAYYCLDNAATYFYRKRAYSWYFISLWNRKNIAQIITVDFMYRRRIPENIIESIKMDYETIDLEKTIQTIPNLGNDNNRFLRDLKDFKFSSDLFYDVVSNSMKASTEATETYFVFAGIPAYEKMRRQVYDYYSYGIHNCLMVDRYRENTEIFDLFARSIFASASAPDKDISDESYRSSGNIHVDFLNAKDIHLVLRYVDDGKLKKMFKEFSINIIKVDESGKKYLEILAENIPAVFGLGMDNEIFWKYICLISHTSLDEKLAVSVLQRLIEIDDKELICIKRDLLIEFINAIYSQKLYKDNKICEKVRKLAVKLIHFVSVSSNNLYYYRVPINLMVSFCKEGGLLLDDENAINLILSEDYYSLLADIYRGCDDNIKDIIKSVFEKWTCPNTGVGYQVYSELVLAGIIKPSKFIEDQALDFLAKHEDNKKKEREKGIGTMTVDDIENYFINLYLSDVLLDIDKFKRIVQEGEDKSLKWLVDLEGYDYSEFDLSWLKECHPSLLEKLSGNNKVKEAVVKIYKNKYSSEYVDSRISKIVIQYFI